MTMTPINKTVQPVNPAMPNKRRVTTLTVGNTKLLLPEGFPQAKLVELLETLGEAQVIDYQYTAKGSIYFPAGDVEITAGIHSLYIVESAEAAHRIGGTL